MKRRIALVIALLPILAACDSYWSDERCVDMQRLLDIVDGEVTVRKFVKGDFVDLSSDTVLRRDDYTIALVSIEESKVLGYGASENDAPNQMLTDIASGLGISELPGGLWEQSAYAAQYTEAAKRLDCDSNLSMDEKTLIATASSTAIDFWTPQAKPIDVLLSEELRIIILVEQNAQGDTLGRLIHEKDGVLHQLFVYGDDAATVLASLGLTAVTNL
ncbi:MAG: hypothetical protein AAGI27_16900 [Pseudomonadota bacterium]